MQLPYKVTYQGQVYAVLGYAGKKYRLSNGTFAPMTECVECVEPKAEDVPFINEGASEPSIALDYADEGSITTYIKPEQPKERKGGRPRKNSKV